MPGLNPTPMGSNLVAPDEHRSLTITLDETTHRSLGDFSAREGTTISALFEAFARKCIDGKIEGLEDLVADARQIAASRRRRG